MSAPLNIFEAPLGAINLIRRPNLRATCFFLKFSNILRYKYNKWGRSSVLSWESVSYKGYQNP